MYQLFTCPCFISHREGFFHSSLLSLSSSLQHSFLFSTLTLWTLHCILSLFCPSFRWLLQYHMISVGLVKWLVAADSEGLSDYTLQYALTLLMNLCLQTAGEE